MARVMTKVCELCGRKVGAKNSCRQVTAGWYCVARGLQVEYDSEAFIYPTPDPVGKSEQAAIEALTPAIREQEAIVDAELKRYEAARAEWLAAYAKAMNAPEAKAHVLRNGDVVQPNGPFAERTRNRLAAKANSAREVLDDIEKTLSRVRGELQRRERALDNAARRGRLVDRGQAVERIND
ncbi:hypothetical protein [Streptomyces sp. NPDC005407]|uniref:hypothetical protein n=1 Tax=Streptomyces sp. NPDC005407 TaxID=3155340 RepID=UPI0033A70ED8